MATQQRLLNGRICGKLALTSAGTLVGIASLFMATPAWAGCTLAVNAATSAAISSTLNKGTDVTLTTTDRSCSGPGIRDTTGSGNIIIDSPITWHTAATLKINAWRSVLINANIIANGTGSKLVINYNTARSTSNDPYLVTQPGAKVTFGGGSPKLTINNQRYIIVTKVSQLRTINQDGTNSWNYALGRDLDLSSEELFTPIGYFASNNSVAFTKVFDGLGHEITGLAIHEPNSSYIGLFRDIQGGIIRNLSLVNGSVTLDSGYNFGGLLAGNAGTGTLISNVSATGDVTGGGNVGCLIGTGGSAGVTISDSHTNCTVIGSDDYIGGLVGRTSNGTIINSSARGTVVGTGDYRSCVGGLVGGIGYTSIISSNASVNITTGPRSDNVGGLVGYGGYNADPIRKSFATGSIVSGENSSYIGGLVGTTDIVLNSSYAKVSVSAGANSSYVGGLVGKANQDISNSYAIGSVSSGDNSEAIGGLVGGAYNSRIMYSYARGLVRPGAASVPYGGLLGRNDGNTTTVFSYWDTTTTRQTGSAGGSGLNDAAMHRQSSYKGWNFTVYWNPPTTTTYPTLRGVPSR